jgi:hypothetical protein
MSLVAKAVENELQRDVEEDDLHCIMSPVCARFLVAVFGEISFGLIFSFLLNAGWYVTPFGFFGCISTSNYQMI